MSAEENELFRSAVALLGCTRREDWAGFHAVWAGTDPAQHLQLAAIIAQLAVGLTDSAYTKGHSTDLLLHAAVLHGVM